jgi:hypothetical protein
MVIVFTGHMIDGADAERARFPASAEPAVYATIKAYLTESHAEVGFSSAACGSDILFLEAMLELGAQVTIVLPSEMDCFIQTSVERGGSGGWRARFQAVVRRADHIVYASKDTAVNDMHFENANVLLYELAQSRAQEDSQPLDALAVWDSVEGKPGGTGSAIDFWRSRGQSIHVIDPLTLRTRELPA